MAFSKDGRWFITGYSSPESEARLWDASNFKLVRFFKLGANAPDAAYVPGVYHLAISSDSKLLATPGDKQGDVWIWDIEGGDRKFVFDGPENEGVRNLDFSPDGKTLAFDVPGKIILWDFAAGDSRKIVPGMGPKEMKFAPDGKHLVAGGFSGGSSKSPGNLAVFDIRDGRKVASRTTHRHRIWCLGFAPDGDKIATGALLPGDDGLRLWSLKELLAHPDDPGEAGDRP